MMNEWFEAITPDVMADLFEDLLAEASEEENISILFNMFLNRLANFVELSTRFNFFYSKHH